MCEKSLGQSLGLGIRGVCVNGKQKLKLTRRIHAKT